MYMYVYKSSYIWIKFMFLNLLLNFQQCLLLDFMSDKKKRNKQNLIAFFLFFVSQRNHIFQ